MTDEGIAERPWGAWKVAHEEPAGTVKVLTVNPGGILSLQTHARRDEFWVPFVTGLVAYVTYSSVYKGGQEATLLEAHKVFKVPRGAYHRLMNPTQMAISVVEIINGTYDENDIVRHHDAYGRQ